MKIQIELNEKDIKLIRTFVRRSIYEQYERNMAECGMSQQEIRDVTYDTITAFNDLSDQLANQRDK